MKQKRLKNTVLAGKEIVLKTGLPNPVGITFVKKKLINANLIQLLTTDTWRPIFESIL